MSNVLEILSDVGLNDYLSQKDASNMRLVSTGLYDRVRYRKVDLEEKRSSVVRNLRDYRFRTITHLNLLGFKPSYVLKELATEMLPYLANLTYSGEFVNEIRHSTLKELRLYKTKKLNRVECVDLKRFTLIDGYFEGRFVTYEYDLIGAKRRKTRSSVLNRINLTDSFFDFVDVDDFRETFVDNSDLKTYKTGVLTIPMDEQSGGIEIVNMSRSISNLYLNNPLITARLAFRYRGVTRLSVDNVKFLSFDQPFYRAPRVASNERGGANKEDLIDLTLVKHLTLKHDSFSYPPRYRMVRFPNATTLRLIDCKITGVESYSLERIVLKMTPGDVERVDISHCPNLKSVYAENTTLIVNDDIVRINDLNEWRDDIDAVDSDDEIDAPPITAIYTESDDSESEEQRWRVEKRRRLRTTERRNKEEKRKNRRRVSAAEARATNNIPKPSALTGRYAYRD